MKRLAPILFGMLIVMALWAAAPARAAAFPINYSDPSSDVVRLNSTTGLCEVDMSGNCISSPDSHDVNISVAPRPRDGLGELEV